MPKGLKIEVVEHELSADECDEIANAFRQDAVTLPSEHREGFLSLADAYRTLANVKRKVARKVN